MKKNQKTYSIFQKASSIFMMLTLLWLTVSTPFVITAQEQLVKQQKALSINSSETGCGDETTDSGNNNIEEKVPTTNTFSEEYLHEYHITHCFVTEVSLYHKQENADDYIAFHGELLVPPPNAA
jgi:hypothetical protein